MGVGGGRFMCRSFIHFIHHGVISIVRAHGLDGLD